MGSQMPLRLKAHPGPPWPVIDLDATLPWGSWMAAAQDGDREIYEQLLRSLIPGLRRCVASTGQKSGAGDPVIRAILQDIHRGRHTYRPERRFEEWVGGIASRHLRRSVLRRRGR